MWRAAGLFRTRERLAEAVERLERARAAAARDVRDAAGSDGAVWSQFNLVTVALLVARAALRREESRGGHFRADFPARDDLHFRVHLVESQSPSPTLE